MKVNLVLELENEEKNVLLDSLEVYIDYVKKEKLRPGAIEITRWNLIQQTAEELFRQLNKY